VNWKKNVGAIYLLEIIMIIRVECEFKKTIHTLIFDYIVQS